MSTTKAVARNSILFGIELVVSFAATIVTSVLVGRAFGPERLSSYTFLLWLTQVAGTLATVGLPATTQKFMAEYLGRGDPERAMSVFAAALRVQCLIAGAVTVAGLGFVWLAMPADFHVAATIMVLAVWPRLVGFIPSRANVAAEDMGANLAPSLSGGLLQVLVVLATLRFDFGLEGLAMAQLAGPLLDMGWKMVPFARRLWQARPPALEPDLQRRMRRFSTEGLGLVLLSLIVWDRSDLVLLRWMNADVRQVTFFSYSFTLIEKLMLLPQTLGGALTASMMAQYGRNPERVASMAVSSGVYLLVVGLPCLLGAAAVSGPLWALYGERFAPVVPVFLIMAVLAVPRIVQAPAQSLLQVHEHQVFLLWWGLACGIINLGVDAWLIPQWGAVGAAIGNGSAQGLSALGIWFRVRRQFQLRIPWEAVARVLLSGAVMAAVCYRITTWMPALPGALAAIAAGAVLYPLMLRLTRALGEEDRARLLTLSRAVPARFQPLAERLAWAVVPAGRGPERLPVSPVSGG